MPYDARATNLPNATSVEKSPESISGALDYQISLLSELMGCITECFEKMDQFLGPMDTPPGGKAETAPSPARILDRIQHHNRIIQEASGALRVLRGRFQA